MLGLDDCSNLVIAIEPVHHLVTIRTSGRIEDIYSESSSMVPSAGLQTCRQSPCPSVPSESRDTEIYICANGIDLV